MTLAEGEAERRAARDRWAVLIAEGGQHCRACYGPIAEDTARWVLPGGGPYAGRGPLHRACHDRVRHGKSVAKRA